MTGAIQQSYPIRGNPRGENYADFLRLLSAVSTHVGLVFRPAFHTAGARKFLSGLKGRSLTGVAEWPGTEVSKKDAGEVFLVEFGVEVRSVLATRVEALYDWLSPDHPEDLFFYNSLDNLVTCFTITHENAAYALATDQDKATDPWYELIDSFTYRPWPQDSYEIEHLQRCVSMIQSILEG